MFTFSMHESTIGATIELTEGLKKRSFASIHFRNLRASNPEKDIERNMAFDHIAPHIRSKYERAYASLDDSEVRSRANAFLTLLCHMLNNPGEKVEEQPDTRYSYEEKLPSIADKPIFPDIHGRRTGVDFDGHMDEFKGVTFDISRYSGVVNSSGFVSVKVWHSDADRIRPAIEKALYSMVEHDRPPDPAIDFRRDLTP